MFNRGYRMKTRVIYLKGKNEYFHKACVDTKCMKNAVHFYIRNTRSGLSKSPEERTHNEIEVLHNVFTGIQAENRKREEAYKKLLAKALKTGGLLARKIIITAFKKAVPMKYPTRDKWFLNYNTLDAVFKNTKHPVYVRMSSQVNQNAIKKAVSEWQSYFDVLKEYKENPWKYKAGPKCPGYSKEEAATAWFTNQTAVLHEVNGKFVLSFINSKNVVPVGKLTGKYIKTEVKPWCGGYRVLVTTDDASVMPEVPVNPKRIMGIDTGVDNLAAVANNYGKTPFLIKGLTVKSKNQWFNKRRAELISCLTRGFNSTESAKTSRALNALSRERECYIRDYFYKAAWYIARIAAEDKVDIILIGHNRGQKDGIDTGHKNNQSFVSIPFTKFISTLKQVAAKCGIPVVDREESYTSKASFLDMDDIPVYREGENNTHTFSGKRVKRGLYVSKDGHAINADINGAANIIRKEYPDAFKKAKDLSWLYTTTRSIGHKDLYKQSTMPKVKTTNKKKHSQGISSRIRTRERWRRKIDYMRFFNTGKRTYNAAA